MGLILALVTIGFLCALGLLLLTGAKPPALVEDKAKDEDEDEPPVAATQAEAKVEEPAAEAPAEDAKPVETPEAMKDVVGKLDALKDLIGYYGVIYGILAAAITLFSVTVNWMTFIAPVANVILVVIALPFGLKKIMSHFPEPNPVVVEETDKMVEFIRNNGKIFAIVGFVAAGLTFFSAFS